uniref:MD-2-related lipid-recognition domain-containing protein n=1 Tax=Graphocephala atropunctata TaxID=36148 RepID=A0A1B6KTE6_9HEMI
MACSGLVLALALGALVTATTDATAVKSCRGQAQKKASAIDISACEAAPCILKKGTTVSINIVFTPDHDIKQLRNRVLAKIAGIPFPFLGVDGTNSCPNIYNADGSTLAGCPLVAGTEYVYKNNFDVLPIYPTVSPLVHWSLQEGSIDVVCFEIQSKIIT